MPAAVSVELLDCKLASFPGDDDGGNGNVADVAVDSHVDVVPFFFETSTQLARNAFQPLWPKLRTLAEFLVWLCRT